MNLRLRRIEANSVSPPTKRLEWGPDANLANSNE